MKYYIQTGFLNDKEVIKEMFIYPEEKIDHSIYEVSKELFYELFEIKKNKDIFINNFDNKDFSYEEFDNLKRLKYDLTNRFKTSIMKHISPSIFIDSYNFVLNNNKLISNGFFITEENREEKYLEILQTENNDELIDILEQYLISMDILSAYNYNMKFYHEMINEINIAETEEELEDISIRFYNKICK